MRLRDESASPRGRAGAGTAAFGLDSVTGILMQKLFEKDSFRA